jgi:hypothetical protein
MTSFIIVLCNTEAAVDLAFKAAEEFLAPRGMELNREKSIIRRIPAEHFTFAGFSFASKIKHGKPKIYSFIE